jgi:peptidoglycan/xylan/chitin deacetylase (PgdA/CDA1 family)
MVLVMWKFARGSEIVERITHAKKEVFLSFDDGPCEWTTPRILDLLKKLDAKASFFVVGERVSKNPELIARIAAEGHGIFSHSADHKYHYFFQGKKVLQNWIGFSLTNLQQHTDKASRAFRPPAGVVTPPLVQASKSLRSPIVLWNHRFYDSVFPWTAKKALFSLAKIQAGDIVLLHDLQQRRHQDLFLNTLELYVRKIQAKGYQCAALSDELLQQEVQHASQSLV